MLEDLGYRVTSFGNVEDIDALIAFPAHLYMVDESLPGINGHTLCIILKSKPATRRVPVILFSGSAELAALASLCAVEAFLAKPFTQDALQRILLEVC
jgi:CheY-like chemotaxis protein